MIGSAVRASRGTTLRQDAITTAIASTFVIGMVLDGRAHNSDAVESFFSPWHMIIYTGFAATVGWTVWLLGGREALRRPERIPAGYAPALLGIGLFALGGLGDLIWHTAFGVEAGMETSLSPPHISLFAGGALLGFSAFRAAWLTDTPSTEPRLRELLPAVLSLALFIVGVLFFFSNSSALTTPLPWTETVAGLDEQGDAAYADRMLLAKVLVTNAILIGAVLLVVRRWSPPPGALTVLLGTIGALIVVVDDFSHAELALPLLAAGAAGDAIVHAARGPRAGARVWLVAGGVPAVLWSTYFAFVALSPGLQWPHQMWSGTVVFTVLCGLALARLAQPPPHAPSHHLTTTEES